MVGQAAGMKQGRAVPIRSGFDEEMTIVERTGGKAKASVGFNCTWAAVPGGGHASCGLGLVTAHGQP